MIGVSQPKLREAVHRPPTPWRASEDNLRCCAA
jgi:hypothetical protein